ncbi:ATP-binding protein [Mediterraneibacter agrestimuris]|uniref:ATP-binding protein n=1 Tax=Mediterraneibacter agrestimuris TaxID=2941333 RepID=UPI002407B5E8|nr:hypothetical protein [Mediterraneibacter agrestimuris]
MELVERMGVHSGDSISVYPTFNIQFIVDKEENVFIIEVNPRSSRTVPFLSKATGYPLADIATKVILGKDLKKQGITEIYPKEKERRYVKVPAFSFAKLNGVDAYLSPEMKSTGEAVGYDKKLHRAMYKAMIASGVHYEDGVVIRSAATQNNITMLTSLDTVKVLLDVLEEVTIGISTIDAE